MLLGDFEVRILKAIYIKGRKAETAHFTSQDNEALKQMA